MNGFLIGAIAGVLVCLSIAFFERVLKVDDPVGAISVHGTCGAFGQLAVGLFADGTASYAGFTVRGLFYGDAGQLAAQVIGMVAAFLWAFGISWVFFKVLDAIVGLRVSPEVELQGLDFPELGVLAYPDGRVVPIPGFARLPAIPPMAAEAPAR
jgi:Amt family ammonium transporter